MATRRPRSPRTPPGMDELSTFDLSSPDTLFGPDSTPSLFDEGDDRPVRTDSHGGTR